MRRLTTTKWKSIFIIILMSNSLAGGKALLKKQIFESYFDYKREKRNAAVHRKWPHGIIPYIVSNTIDDTEAEQICRAMIDIELHSCIRFRPFGPEYTSKQFVYISNVRPYCFATVGFDSVRVLPSILNLAHHCFLKRGVVEHELLHVIGLYHEHSRPDRDDHVVINLENIPDGVAHNFNVEDSDLVSSFGLPYDVNSVMHYSSHSFSLVSNIPTIISKRHPNVIMGQREGPSLLDFRKVYLMYECNRTGQPAIGSFKPALSRKIAEFKSVKKGSNFDKFMSSLLYGEKG